ncbi:helix-turn-helix transcriptional regulator [Rhodococcus sp. NPDC060176]|uniref:helix-turn-helix transcriptional regulator n=1 Tax=Rhodococcus sp. NPDC060176 TaxID=3347062 RepID=UPI003647E5F9
MIDEDPDSPMFAHVGANVRRLRATAELSQVALAELSGLSRRTVIKLESGEANVSLSGLDHLARALRVSIVDLVASPVSSHARLDEVAWRGAGDSVAILSAAVPARREAQLWSWNLAVGERYDAEPDETGTHAIIYVAAGQLLVDRLDGCSDLQVGDHCVFPSDQRFSYVNAGRSAVRFVRILTD